jgi:hypothetical protein
MTVLQILEDIKSRVKYAGIGRCPDVQRDQSLPQVKFSIYDSDTGEITDSKIVELAAKYFAVFQMALPVEILCDIEQEGGYISQGRQLIYVIDAQTAHYGSPLVANYDQSATIPKADKWFNAMEEMIAAGMIDSWAFVNTEPTGLGSDIIGNVKLIKNGQAINLDGTPASGAISLWENKDGQTIQIERG